VNFFLGSLVMVFPWIALGYVLRQSWMRLALATCVILAVAVAQVTFLFPHYVAPITCVVFVLVIQGMRHVRLWNWHDQPLGRYVVGAVPLVCLATLAFSIAGMVSPDPKADYVRRARMQEELIAEGGKHLIVVRYGTKDAFDCWVYNMADIDAAPVVWAREMDAEHNRRLLSYFRDRHAWLLDTDTQPPTFVPYPSPYKLEQTAGQEAAITRSCSQMQPVDGNVEPASRSGNGSSQSD
jgi:hypothetical protein